MTVEFKLPELGENVSAGTLVTLYVTAGNPVKIDQPVLEIETDKAVIEVPSSVNGMVAAVLVKPGDKVSPGQVIFTLQGDDQPAIAVVPAPPEAKPQPVTPPLAPIAPPPLPTPAVAVDIVFKLPDLGENIKSGTIVNIFVAVGEPVKINQPVLEIETDKAVIEVPVSVAGQIKEVLVKPGDKVSPEQPVLVLVAAPEKTPPQPELPREMALPAAPLEPPWPPAPIVPPPPPPAPVPVSAPLAPPISPPAVGNILKPLELVPAAPSVRRIAREIGIDITEVPGSGPGGRVSMDDVKAFSRRRNLELTPQLLSPPIPVAPLPTIAAPAELPLPDFSKWGQISREPMSNVRRVTAEHLAHAWHAPHVTQFDKADITDLESLRKKYSPRVEAAGAKLTVTAMLIKMITTVLKEFPQFNASIDIANQEIIYKKYYHIGIAVDTPRGLLVPVIRNADRKSIIAIATELNGISERARNRKTGPDELTGGTFSISNLGGIGGTAFTPIINAPEVAILGVSRGQMEPVFNKTSGQFEPRMMLPLSLSYDHRLVDGADGARFIRRVVDALENPFLLALEG